MDVDTLDANGYTPLGYAMQGQREA